MKKEQYHQIADSLGQFINNKMTLRFCDRFDGRSSVWNFQKHSHNYFELIYFINGKAKITTDSEEVVMALYDMIVYPQGLMHQESLDVKYEHEVICIGVEFEGNPQMESSFHLPDRTGEIKWFLERIYEEKKMANNLHEELITSYIKSVFLLMRRYFLSYDPEISDVVLKTTLYIQENFKEDITMDSISQISCVSKSYLSRLFKKETGLTVMQYLNYYRIERSKSLIKFSKYNISEIGNMVGFNDPKYFSRMFKKIVGISPKNFEKQILEI
ncbi:AraC family transcriptional regulator [Vallitalea longa]|uniref:AraC family transcriptional regulator n=1 Tax=Vallitalea longa TaxID=2936439 RepID=A0A9W5Y860_9FIRM|nr:AraC family transcriptional regulator [Vallitalea longa]GKX27695.1 AraC family transcriptional regulator [Vallitalea longa]